MCTRSLSHAHTANYANYLRASYTFTEMTLKVEITRSMRTCELSPAYPWDDTVYEWLLETSQISDISRSFARARACDSGPGCGGGNIAPGVQSMVNVVKHDFAHEVLAWAAPSLLRRLLCKLFYRNRLTLRSGSESIGPIGNITFSNAIWTGQFASIKLLLLRRL